MPTNHILFLYISFFFSEGNVNLMSGLHDTGLPSMGTMVNTKL